MFKTAEQSSEPTTSRSAVKRSTYRLHLSSRGADKKTLAWTTNGMYGEITYPLREYKTRNMEFIDWMERKNLSFQKRGLERVRGGENWRW